MQYLIPATARRDLHGLNLKAGSWGGNDVVCMMSGLVAGAQSTGDCVTAGWPGWLAELNVSLFDASVGGDENAARLEFAYDVAKAVSIPRDYDRSRDLFLIRRLDDGDYSALKSLSRLKGDVSQQIAAVVTVVGLLRRRLAGEDVEAEMRAAADSAADAAACVAFYAAADAAADAALYAALYAARAARAAADAAADAALYAALYAARADLIFALNAA